MTSEESSANFRPRILVFYCGRCQDRQTPSSVFTLPTKAPEVDTVHFTCAREIDPGKIRQAFRDGADGVLICGCLVRDCDSDAPDVDILRDLYRNQVVVKSMGLETDRLREEWILEGTTDDVDGLIADFSSQLRNLGPAARKLIAPAPDLRAREEQG